MAVPPTSVPAMSDRKGTKISIFPITATRYLLVHFSPGGGMVTTSVPSLERATR